MKADGRFAPLPIAASRSVALGGTVATVGFPDPAMRDRGSRPSWPREIDSLWLLQIYALIYFTGLAKGEIASLSGAADDPRYFHISVVFTDGHDAAGQGWSSSFSLLVQRGTR